MGRLGGDLKAGMEWRGETCAEASFRGGGGEGKWKGMASVDSGAFSVFASCLKLTDVPTNLERDAQAHEYLRPSWFCIVGANLEAVR